MTKITNTRSGFFLPRFCVLATILGMTVGALGRAEAGVIYNNFQPGVVIGYDFGGTPQQGVGDFFGAHFDVALSFTVGSEDQTFDAVEIALGIGNGMATTIALMTDGGGFPGTILESFATTPPAGFPAVLVKLDSLLHPLLSAGQTYWIADLPAVGAFHGWVFNGLGLKGYKFRMNDVDWVDSQSFSPGLRVSGTSAAVPEPSTFIVLSTLGALSILGRRRHRRRPV